jgi:hypothetical protein
VCLVVVYGALCATTKQVVKRKCTRGIILFFDYRSTQFLNAFYSRQMVCNKSCKETIISKCAIHSALVSSSIWKYKTALTTPDSTNLSLKVRFYQSFQSIDTERGFKEQSTKLNSPPNLTDIIITNTGLKIQFQKGQFNS